MPTYTMHFAKTHLSDLVARAEAGEEVVLARGDKPAAHLVPMAPTGPRRRPGRLRGKVAIGPEFFEPLPEEELAAWGGPAGCSTGLASISRRIAGGEAGNP